MAVLHRIMITQPPGNKELTVLCKGCGWHTVSPSVEDAIRVGDLHGQVIQMSQKLLMVAPNFKVLAAEMERVARSVRLFDDLISIRTKDDPHQAIRHFDHCSGFHRGFRV